ncbi:hypothetical protein C8034_v010672 [Colletotrichum sidae]|uniref:Uncharacterized protein n=1 Tax=Colletotrichum sidae TaxID=1347389 RepID=A0A4R8TA34_9PEZI|nr:hypothetical protein C8034_v010672 [Colletotrichum sidae]
MLPRRTAIHRADQEDPAHKLRPVVNIGRAPPTEKHRHGPISASPDVTSGGEPVLPNPKSPDCRPNTSDQRVAKPP